ncbi:tRNA guanosine methyltransferase [Diplonema papillatum]|nr:tRNA (guanosine(18)-2prime-O)-methyltransferase [Diplonema papillatum]KAJ9471536.1 tRNA guanosine methyltransferase [Diplonema papillatum]
MAAAGFEHAVGDVVDQEELARLRRAERVLRDRVGNVTLVLEKCSNAFNQQAVLRTAEAMGIQRIYLVKPTLPKRHAKSQKERAKQADPNTFEWGHGVGVTSGCERWISIKHFDSTAECVTALKAEGHSIWATDLDRDAVCLDTQFASSKHCPNPLPEKVAVVMGSEAEGISREMIDAADLRVYLPMHGFTDSFNVGVASALSLQAVIAVVGRQGLPADELKALREQWFRLLSSNPTVTAVIDGYLAEGRVPEPLDDLRAGRGNPEGPRIIKKVRRKQEEALRLQQQQKEEEARPAQPQRQQQKQQQQEQQQQQKEEEARPAQPHQQQQTQQQQEQQQQQQQPTRSVGAASLGVVAGAVGISFVVGFALGARRR